MSRKLSAKQENFVEEYLVDLNATQAAIRAGYSAKTACEIGHENLRKPHIEAAIRERREQIAAETGITQERVLSEYARIAFLDPAKLFDKDGRLKNINDMDIDVRAAIAGIDATITRIGDGPGGELTTLNKIKIANKLKALEDLSKHLGLFEKDNRQKIDPSLLTALLSSFPSEFADQVKKSIIERFGK